MNDLNRPAGVAERSDDRGETLPGGGHDGRPVRHVGAARVIRLLIVVAATLTALSVGSLIVRHTMVKGVAGREWLDHPVRHFDLNREGNTPTIYQGLSLLLCAATLWGIGSAEAANAAGVSAGGTVAVGRDRRGRVRAGAWRGLALIFAYLACDELFKWHERTIDPLRAWLKIEGGALRYAWVIPGAAVVGLFALAYARFWFRLPPDTRRRFAIAGVLYVGGALGMEVAGGQVQTRHGYHSVAYVAVAQIEEVLEMAGVIVFMHALLAHAAAHVAGPLRLGRLAVRIDAKTDRAASGGRIGSP